MENEGKGENNKDKVENKKKGENKREGTVKTGSKRQDDEGRNEEMRGKGK